MSSEPTDDEAPPDGAPPDTAPAVSPGARTWARRPGAAALLTVARAKLEAGYTSDSLPLPVTLTAEQRDDVAVLLGAPWQNSGRRPTLGQLRRALADKAGTDLEALLTVVCGPLRDLRAEQASAHATLTADQAAARATLVAAGIDPELANRSVPRLVSQAAAADVARIWAALPHGAANIGLARLASDTTGDSHALDRDQPLGRTLAKLLAQTHLPADADVGTARDWRAAWAAAGVDCDAVSATVLVLGVHLDGDGPAAAQSRAFPGEPVWLTARAIDAGDWSWPAGVVVRVCENPSVVEAAAAALAERCPPLVCTFGQPSTAATTLLAGLADTHQVYISADHDPAGRSIAARVRAVAGGGEPWLPALVSVYEEARIDAMLADLRKGQLDRQPDATPGGPGPAAPQPGLPRGRKSGSWPTTWLGAWPHS